MYHFAHQGQRQKVKLLINEAEIACKKISKVFSEDVTDTFSLRIWLQQTAVVA